MNHQIQPSSEISPKKSEAAQISNQSTKFYPSQTKSLVTDLSAPRPNLPQDKENESTTPRFDQMALNPYAQSYYYGQNQFFPQSMNLGLPIDQGFYHSADILYPTDKDVVQAFPHLAGINDSEFNVDDISADAHFYVLRSSNDDNIHKAIKYHLWTSSPYHNKNLSEAWKEFDEKKETPPIYLIFSVVTSQQFLGVAQLSSDVNNNESFQYWWEENKWFGSFQLKWLFIKDIPFSKFEHIKDETNSNNLVTNLKDGTKISSKCGKLILNLFKTCNTKKNIFEYFDYMDKREEFIKATRDNNPYSVEQFNNLKSMYAENPYQYPFVKPYHNGQQFDRKRFNKFGQFNKYRHNNYNGHYNRQRNDYYNRDYNNNDYNNRNRFRNPKNFIEQGFVSNGSQNGSGYQRFNSKKNSYGYKKQNGRDTADNEFFDNKPEHLKQTNERLQKAMDSEENEQEEKFENEKFNRASIVH